MAFLNTCTGLLSCLLLGCMPINALTECTCQRMSPCWIIMHAWLHTCMSKDAASSHMQDL